MKPANAVLPRPPEQRIEGNGQKVFLHFADTGGHRKLQFSALPLAGVLSLLLEPESQMRRISDALWQPRNCR